MRKTAVVLLLLLSGPALADDNVAAGAAPAGEAVTLTFDQDDTIEGRLRTPDGELLEARKLSRHRNLIQLRKHFRREMLRLVNRL